MYKIKLKNSKDMAFIDQSGYNFITKDDYLIEIDFMNNLRKHSSGCCVFQRNIKNDDGSYRVETIYLHKLLAEKFLTKQSDGRNLVGAKNGNKLDCQVKNLIFRTRAESSRVKKTTSRTGYTGVYPEGVRYRAVIGIKGKTKHIGMYDTAEEAATAYNQISFKYFGDRGKINVLKTKEPSSKKAM